jgi:uncharacterized protein YjlB
MSQRMNHLNRRQFGAVIAALGVTAAGHAQSCVHTETLQLSHNGWMPNNDRLPVLLYRRAFQASATTADQMEETFRRNAWPAQWRNGVYDFHHYHSTAHEVLGIAAGSATIILGGEGGHQVSVEAGDVLVLPTGTGHCRLSADTRFLVIGAYPADQHWDVCRAAPDSEAIARMRTLPFPPTDPVLGGTGELARAWRS